MGRARMWPFIETRLAQGLALAWGDVRYPHPLPLGSPYGERIHPVTGQLRHHDGIDIPIPRGCPVMAPWNGRVVRVDVDGIGAGAANGNCVHLTCGLWGFAFLHLDSVAVDPGEQVKGGQLLGRVGSTGLATGPHLHLQATLAGVLFDPAILYPRLFIP